MDILRANQRGVTSIDWLESNHSFAFGRSWPEGPHAMGFRSLRVLNDDRVGPGGGFAEHGHDNMEIVSIVLEGGLSHRDSTGSSSTIHRGDVQRMTAGSGIRHSEFNSSDTDSLHFLQIWLRPDREGLEPGYEEKKFEFDTASDRFHLIASQGSVDGSLHIHQDAKLYIGKFGSGTRGSLDLETGRNAWVHVIEGAAIVNGERLETGDGAAISDPGGVDVEGDNGLVLVFDLA